MDLVETVSLYSTSDGELFAEVIEHFGINRDKWNMFHLFVDGNAFRVAFNERQERLYWSMDKESGSTRLDYWSKYYVTPPGDEDLVSSLKIEFDWDKYEARIYNY